MQLGGLLRAGLTLGVLVYVTVLVAYFGLLALGKGGMGWPALMRELTLYLFLPVPVLLLAALVCRARLALLVSAVPVLLFLGYYGPRFVPQPAPAVGADNTFRVLSFNAGGNAGGGQLGPLLRAIREVDADLVALQEVPPATLAALRAELAAAYPQQVGTSDAAALSRFPLRAGPDLQLGGSPYVGQQVRVAVHGREVTLLNVHVTRPRYRIQWRRGVVPLVRGYNPAERDAEVAELMRVLSQVRGPRLLTGDFNESEWSRPYQFINAELDDSFHEAGRGFGHTYPSNVEWGGWRVSLPLLRIDYIFHSPELAALRAWVGPDGGSDHLPVVAELAFR